MTDSPISFEQLAGGREAAKLGLIEVGTISPWPFGGRANWTIHLPPLQGSTRGALSLQHAKRGLLFKIADWLDCIGDQQRAAAVRAQADQLEVPA